jgi:hypothetical protein
MPFGEFQPDGVEEPLVEEEVTLSGDVETLEGDGVIFSGDAVAFDGGYVAAGVRLPCELLNRLGAEPVGETPCEIFDELDCPAGVSSVAVPPDIVELSTFGLSILVLLGLSNGDELVHNGDGLPPPSKVAGELAGPLDVVPNICGAGAFSPGICTLGGLENACASAGASSGFFPMYI